MMRMKTRSKRKKTGISVWLMLALSVALSSGQTSSAQTSSGTATTRTIEGRVLTQTGAPVPGAVVLLKDNKTLQVRSYIAQADGAYHFFGLSSEVNYTLRAEDRQMTSKQKMVSVFDSHPDVKLDLKLSQEIKPAKK